MAGRQCDRVAEIPILFVAREAESWKHIPEMGDGKTLGLMGWKHGDGVGNEESTAGEGGAPLKVSGQDLGVFGN